jgi:hypothetical protein
MCNQVNKIINIKKYLLFILYLFSIYFGAGLATAPGLFPKSPSKNLNP